MSETLRWPGFGPAHFLLPRDCDLSKWSVIACDQYAAQPDYWARVDRRIGDAPSARRLILPEANLSDGHTVGHLRQIHQTMEEYLNSGLFQSFPDALIYVERWLSGGRLRRGLVGVVDLEEYDDTGMAGALVRASERTVFSRIPPRVAIRRSAALELSHVMLLLDDVQRTVIEPLTAQTDQMRLLYDFDLMEDGGHITGYLLTREQQAEVCAALNEKLDPQDFCARYGARIGEPPVLFVVGDGNHSLASAKAVYQERKMHATQEEWSKDPARYAMAELVNLHDESLAFEAIHRVCFSVDPEKLLQALLEYYPETHFGDGEGQSFRCVWEEGERTVTIPDPISQLTTGTLQGFLEMYLSRKGGYVDYVHGEETAAALGRRHGNIAFLLPAMDKEDLFRAVIHDGALPRKTFSMGEAHDKRFYLEARRIK